jgi:hypothetical protein
MRRAVAYLSRDVNPNDSSMGCCQAVTMADCSCRKTARQT